MYNDISTEIGVLEQGRVADEQTHPLISVIIPAYNASHTLGETLESVDRQEYQNLEILIVDDGSTDATAQIAADFCARNHRARLLSKRNGGVASARNMGIAQARGAFVAPLDADDLWHPHYLAKLVAKAVGSHPRPGFVFSSFRPIDANSDILGSGTLVNVDGTAALQMALCNFVGNGSAMLIDRAAALSAGGYDARLRAAGAEGCEDHLLQMIITSRYPIASVPEFLVGYRRLPGSMSADHERMFASGTLANSIFAANSPGLQIPDWALRWSQTRRLLALAQQRLYRARWIGAAALFCQSLRLDPLMAAATGLDRTARLASKVFRALATAKSVVAFYSADPTAIELHGIPAPRRSGLLLRLEQARLRRVEQMDRAFPCSGENRTSDAPLTGVRAAWRQNAV